MGLDPLAMLANLIASRRFELLSVIALIPIALALVFGRSLVRLALPAGDHAGMVPVYQMA